MCCAAQDLLVLRADTTAVGLSGRTAVQMAQSSGSVRIQELLEEHAAALRARPPREDGEDTD